MENASAFSDDLVLKSDDTNDDQHEAIVTKAVDDLKASIADRLSASEKKSTDRLDSLEAAIKRINIGGRHTAGESEDNGALERKAFDSYMRRGIERMAADEAKAMTVASGTDGGFLAPTAFGDEILKKLVQYSPVRQYARVVPISAPAITYPRKLTGMSGAWVAETDDRTPTGMTYDQKTLTPYEYASYVPVSAQLLEDNTYNLEGELSLEFALDFAKSEGAAFVNGNGTGKPKGLVASTEITNIIKTGVAADFPASNQADVLKKMFYALPDVHAQNAVWFMNRTTRGVISQWKNPTTGGYLIDDLNAQTANTLLGRPIVEMVDFPSVGAGAFPIMLGDPQGYRIIDRVGVSILRDPYTMATKGQVVFHARRRVGGDVTHGDRFVKLQCAV